MDIEKVTIPAVMDSPDAEMEKAYKAWPYRVVGLEQGQLALDAKFKAGIDVKSVRGWLECQVLVQDLSTP
jgi:hypothetical protein